MKTKTVMPRAVFASSLLAFGMTLPGAGNFVLAGEMIVNPSFEQVDARGLPDGWIPMAFGNPKADAAKSCALVDMAGAPDGQKVIRLTPDVPQISLFVRSVNGLSPGQWYEVSGSVKCQDLKGQGASIMVEFGKGTRPAGTVDTLHVYGTTDWKRYSVRFLAPPDSYQVKITCIQVGGPGTAWFDNLAIKQVDPPNSDLRQRKVIDVPFFGIYTHTPSHVHKYIEAMAKEGVGLTRQGENTLYEDPAQIELMKNAGMKNVLCAVRYPVVSNEKNQSDPCFPINSVKYEKQLHEEVARMSPITRVYEMFNEPNMRVGNDWGLNWSLPAYINLCKIAGRVIKEQKSDILLGTGGFSNPMVGYTEALLNGLEGKYIDIVLLHPYAVDEPLDSILSGIGDVCQRTGRPDLAVAISETGFASWDAQTPCKNFTWFVSEKEQAADIIKLHVQALAYKLSFVAYLGWNDFTEPSDCAQNMGMVRVDGSKKPSYYAYQFMLKTLGKRQIENWTYANDATRCYRFTGEKPVWALWNAVRHATTTVDVGSTTVFVCDLFGAKLSVVPASGKIKLDVGEDPIYIVPAGN